MKRILLGLAAALALVGAVVVVMLVGGFDFRPSPEIGSVDTEWRLIGTDAKVAIDAFDDPKVDGVSCFISRPRAGGVTGSLGLREDPSDASIACRQVGPIRFLAPIRNGERVFSERRSLVFKTLKVARFYDAQRKSLVYLTYTTRVMVGSDKNAISAVPLMPWGNVAAGTPVLADAD